MRFSMSSWVSVLGLCLLVSLTAMIGCGPPPPVPEGPGLDAGLPPQGESSKEAVPSPDTPKPESGQSCQTACDCPQSLDCSNGTCVSATAPVYCCDKRGCAAGKACKTRTGSDGTCGSAGSLCNVTCDCQSGLGCLNGQCTKFDAPVYCCADPKNCPANAKCEDRDGKEGTCGGIPPACKTHCDCPQGQACTKGACGITDEVVYCCSKAGCPEATACFNIDGTPGKCGSVVVGCKIDADCKVASCNSQGNVCVQNQEICQAGKCVGSSNTIPNAQCTAAGKCVSNAECKSHCDCKGSLGCLNGACIDTGVSYYCCSDPQCPTGSTCYRADNSTSTCGGAGGCKTDQDCPATTCSDAGVDCYERLYACDTATGKCISSSLTFRNSLCEQGKGRCAARPAVCRVDCDCPQRQGCVGGFCVATATPKYCCDTGGCPAGQPCVDKAGQAGTCPASPTCVTDLDCGKPYCASQGTSCVESTPACTAGACGDSTKMVPNTTCDLASGLCKPACTQDSDCLKPSCQQNGKLCERKAGQCRNGQCQVAASADVGTCGAGGICTPPSQCQSHCDCAQGNFCYQGKCVRSSYPVYCCDNPGCPAGYTCYGANSQESSCPVACSSPCDCGEGEDCVGGVCSKPTLGAIYCCDNASKCPVGATCRDKNNQASTCPQRPRPCKGACDCIQGEACVSGSCTKSAQPTYCCEKEGCPAGLGCESVKNLSGTCEKACQTPCDCAQGYNCIAGRCNNDPAITSPTYCCSNPGCPTGQYCRRTDNQYDQCPTNTCKTSCDCNQGEDCQAGRCTQTSPPVYCCSKPGCPSSASCKDTSGSWKSCPTTPACTNNCDCAQGEDCFRGQCIGVHPPVYCCDKTNCPTGQACNDKNNKAGFCPTVNCKTACDCQFQGQTCVNGRCVIVTGGARVYCCSKPYCPAGNNCEDAQGNLKLCSSQQCTSPCDCNLGEDCRNGVCVNVNPPVYCCSGPFCPPGGSCVKSDNTTARCP